MVELLAGDVLELDAGKGIHKHGGKLTAAFVDGGQDTFFVGDDFFVAAGKRTHLFREYAKNIALFLYLLSGQCMAKLCFDGGGYALNAMINTRNRLVCFLGEFANFIGYNSKAPACFSSAGGFNGCIQGEQVGLCGNISNQLY